MAYGMQIPQVPFSYFYPTKIPPPSGGAGVSGGPSSHSNLPVTPTDAKTSSAASAGHYPKLVAPLNFSKREAELKYDMDDIERKLYHRDYASPSAVSKHQSPASQHEHKSDISEQELMAEENENVEID